MNQFDSKDLLAFYHGKVDENERTLVEEFLFQSEVGLMEYFSIKRDVEVNITQLDKPSPKIKEKLLHKLHGFRPATVFRHRRSWIATACGLALVGGFYLWQADQYESDELSPENVRFSIDTALDASAGSSFL